MKDITIKEIDKKIREIETQIDKGESFSPENLIKVGRLLSLYWLKDRIRKEG